MFTLPNLLKKLAFTTGIIIQIKQNIPTEMYKNLYHTFCESHLTYDITSWGRVCDIKLETLFKPQKKSVSEFYLETNKHI